nr:tetratricopeptide repeat protein [Nostoc sp. UIC 10630]
MYNWLDGSDRWLQPLLDRYRQEGIVLAITSLSSANAVTEKLAHLPWEVLHDGNGFLVQRVPAIVPVRWVSDSTVKKLTIEGEPENQALQVLFMATSPLNVEPVLDFEGEEARILEATKRQPLALTVEESGCLSELGYLVDGYDRDYFDVLHLTGHATLQDGQPRFITETATGEAFYASAGDIAQELQFRLPNLIFLSGCRTGQAGNGGSVSSMAEELLKSGAKAVLGWGQNVLDADATAAAAALYEELSAGKQIIEAVACTYQALIKNKARDWHLLRLYAAGNLPSSLVTPLRTRGRKPAPLHSVSTQFLDPAGKVKVPTRESFVGRRRQLQNCLRVLSQSTDEVGVLIHGMGGLGKSSLAARLCDRLPNFERVVWVGRIDEASLVNRLTEKLDDNEQRKSLQNYDEELRFRLRRVFQQLHEEAKPFLLVLDDFEVNLEPRDQNYVLQSEAAEVMKALVWAIRENSTSHRIIITCRYDFEFTQLQHFYKQPLEGMRGADLRKKCNLLTAFSVKSQVDEALKSQAQKLADGNPRLLEWLDKILQNKTVDVATILNRLAADPVELRELVLAETLLEQMDTTMREMLSRGLVFELPVPREALAAVCDSIANLEHYISRAVALGLLEVSHDEALRVPRILPVQLPEDGEVLHKQAAEVLYRLWWEEVDRAELRWIAKIPMIFDYPFDWAKVPQSTRDERVLEIHRLALQGHEEMIGVKTGLAIAKLGNYRNQWQKVVKTCEDTLRITEDYRLFNNLTIAEQRLGNVDKALESCHKALELCPPEDEEEKASILSNLASIKAMQHNFDEAIYLYKKVLEFNINRDDIGEIATQLNNIGTIKFNQGKLDEALDLYQQTLRLDNPIMTPDFKSTVLNNIANIYSQQGLLDKALVFLEQSLKLSQSIGNTDVQASALHAMGRIYDMQGKFEEAIIILYESLKLKQCNGDIEGKAATLSTLGQILAEEQEDFTNGLAYLEESFEIYKKLKSPNKVQEIRRIITSVQQQQAIALHNRALTKIQQGYFDEAIILFRQSLTLTECIDDMYNNANTLGMLGQLLADAKRDFPTGLDYLHKSLDILQRLESPNAKITTQIIFRIQRKQALSLYKRAKIELEQEQPEKAITLLQKSLAITKQISDFQGQAITLWCLGHIAEQQGNYNEALDYLQPAFEILQRIQSPDAEEVRQLVVRVQGLIRNS